jgi:hypothetical protein
MDFVVNVAQFLLLQASLESVYMVPAESGFAIFLPIRERNDEKEWAAAVRVIAV